MTATYDPAQLGSYALSLWGANCPVYQIRFYLGDTDSSSWLLQDEEIAWAYSVRGNTWGATALCAMALEAKYSRIASMSADGVSQSLSNLCAQFRTLAAEYQKKEVIHAAQPQLYGVSVSDMLATMQNSDRVPDIFRIGIFDNPPSSGADFFSEGVSGSDQVADEPIIGPF
jgi:hypothetical protein